MTRQGQIISFTGLERWLSDYENWMFLQRTQVWFPTPHTSYSYTFIFRGFSTLSLNFQAASTQVVHIYSYRQHTHIKWKMSLVDFIYVYEFVWMFCVPVPIEARRNSWIPRFGVTTLSAWTWVSSKINTHSSLFLCFFVCCYTESCCVTILVLAFSL